MLTEQAARFYANRAVTRSEAQEPSMVRASKVDYARGVPRAGMEEDTLAFALTALAALSPSQRELGREHHKQHAEHQGIDGEPSHECGEFLHRREQYGQPPKQRSQAGQRDQVA